jgi:hypothetical protein
LTLTVKLNLTNTIQVLLLRLIVVKLSKTNDMKKIIGLSILTALTLISCTPIILLQQTEFNEIPVGSKMVFVTVDYSKDSLFNRVSKSFARYGCPVKSDKGAMQVLCDGKSVEGGTLMKIQAFVDDEGNGSSVLFSGDWGLDGNGQIAMKAFAGMTMYSTMPIIFNGRGTTKPDVAFQHMVILAKQLDGKITYR